MNEVINTFTGVIVSDDINGDSAVSIAKIISGLDDKKLGEISFRRKGHAKTFAAMRKSLKIGVTVVYMSSDQLSQGLLASVVQDEAALIEIFSFELLGVSPSLFHNNREMRKNNKTELMNEISIF